MIRFVIGLLIILSSPLLLDAQEFKVLLGEITKRPQEEIGEWEVAGRTMKAIAESRVDTSDNAAVGHLAIVEFIERDSVTYITALQATEFKVAEFDDGPHVLWKDDKTAEVLSMKSGKVERKLIRDISGDFELNDVSPNVASVLVRPQEPTPPKSFWEAPEKLLAISDLEGNYAHAVKFLQTHGVIDDDGHWIWGKGHLVFVGDIVDRGSAVTETLWMIRRLEKEAQDAGGQVHYVLGNHEAMVMAGDLRYVHLKYHFAAQQYGVTYDDLHGANSEIGRWLRSKNAVVRVGDFLFVHGGYSPTLDVEKIDPDRLNEMVRSRLGAIRINAKTVGEDPAGHRLGPFWYRGYFPRYSNEWGGLPSDEQMQSILDRHQAKHVVVGHTVVDEVGPINDAGTVIAIDTKWAEEEKCQGLLQENGTVYRLLMNGKREEILATAER